MILRDNNLRDRKSETLRDFNLEFSMERNIANVDNGNSSAPLALCTIPTKTEAQLYIYTLWSYKTTPSFLLISSLDRRFWVGLYEYCEGS